MPRLRNRIRRRVAEPLEEPAAGEEQEPEDAADEDGEEPEPEPTDPTARALDEESYSGRIGGGGTVADIAPGQLSRLSQQVTTGSGASVNIADQFDPGFTRTEIVNRLGMVLSLSFSYDYDRGEWVPDPIDKTERQAVEQQLAEDRATDTVENVVEPQEGTTTDSQGNLELEGVPDGAQEWDFDSRSSTGAGGPGEGIIVQPDADRNTVQAECNEGEYPVPGWELIEVSSGDVLDTASGGAGQRSFSAPMATGVEYAIAANSNTEYGSIPQYSDGNYSYSIPGGTVEAAYANGRSSAAGYLISQANFGSKSDTGTAKSTFDNPCTASSTRSAQYDVCSRSKDVTVHLYEGDPDDPDSILLRDDISQREDIVDIPDSRTDLQYQIIIERGPDGESPKVSRLGHQLIR